MITQSEAAKAVLDNVVETQAIQDIPIQDLPADSEFFESTDKYKEFLGTRQNYQNRIASVIRKTTQLSNYDTNRVGFQSC